MAEQRCITNDRKNTAQDLRIEKHVPLKNGSLNSVFGHLLTKKKSQITSKESSRENTSLHRHAKNITKEKKTGEQEHQTGNDSSLLIPPSLILAQRQTPQDQPLFINHAYAFFQNDDDINRLIKKLTLSFSTKHNESEFVIGYGVLQGTRFQVVIDKQNMSLNIMNASSRARQLINKHQNLLKNRLAVREINLQRLAFI